MYNINMKNENDNLIESSINVFGMWKDRDFDTDDYVRELRKTKRLYDFDINI